METHKIYGTVRGRMRVTFALDSMREGRLGDAVDQLRRADKEYQGFAERLRADAVEIRRGGIFSIFRANTNDSARKLEKRAEIYDEKAWRVAQLAYGLEIVHKGEKTMTVIRDREFVNVFRDQAERAARIIERLRRD